jgi:hypothetical protein
MAQLTLPFSIDASTEIIASEHQANYVAIRDKINGDLEGGVGGNLKANGVTALELADVLLKRGIPGVDGAQQEGVVNDGELKVTPGAGLVLNYATGIAWILDDSALVSAAALVPVAVAGSTVTVGANASGNPRIDQIIATLTGWNTATISVLAGTPAGGATLDNRSGAAGLPVGAIRLADVLMPNGFAGPFVQNTHIRDRRPWARGAHVARVRATNFIFDTTPDVLTDFTTRLESSNRIMHVTLMSPGSFSGAGATQITVVLKEDGVSLGSRTFEISAGTHTADAEWAFVPAAGSHLYTVELNTTTFSADLVGPATLRFQEQVLQNQQNEGA